MRLKPNRLCLAVVLAVALPAVGVSSIITGISVSGSTPTTCDFGSCTAGALSAGALTIGNSTSGSYNFNVTATDGDIYDVSGTFNNSFPSGTFLGFFPTVTLISTTAVGADTITLDMLQDFAFGDDTTDWSGSYNEHLPLDLSAAGTSAEGQVLYSTDVDTTPQSVGLLGPVSGPGIYSLSGSAILDPLTGKYLIGDSQVTFSFPNGAPAGTSISSPIPEPSQTISLAIGLAGLLLFKLRKMSSGGIRA